VSRADDRHRDKYPLRLEHVRFSSFVQRTEQQHQLMRYWAKLVPRSTVYLQVETMLHKAF